jgi:2-keto-3-deoxy-L-rhamnonate aldolase RhmA
MKPNPIKQRVLRGGHAFGSFAIEFFSPGYPQICKNAGCEFVLFDMEHSGVSIETMKTQLALCRGLDIVPFVRVPTTGYQYIARLLDLGAMGLMVPMVETPEQAQYIVDCCRYPPSGRRGAVFGGAHDDYQGADVAQKIKEVHARTLIICQIETDLGAQNAEKIAAVDGVDCLWVGQFDLTNFLGIPAQFDHPLYRQAIRGVLAACKKHGKIPGFMALDEKWARQYVQMGFRLLAYGIDAAIMQNGLSAGIGALKAAAAKERAAKPLPGRHKK